MMTKFNEPDYFAVKTSIENRSSNFYVPEEKNDTYDYKKSWFVRSKTREEMLNGEQYKDHEAILLDILDRL